jgi:hypothetical protein
LTERGWRNGRGFQPSVRVVKRAFEREVGSNPLVVGFGVMVKMRHAGIEPAANAWEASMLPLHQWREGYGYGRRTNTLVHRSEARQRATLYELYSGICLGLKRTFIQL